MARKIEYIEALFALSPNTQCAVNGDQHVYENIEWRTTPVISKVDLDAKVAELQADWDAKEYQRDRNLAKDRGGTNTYPDIGDQLDMLWHDKKNDTTTWEDAIQVVKDAHPKP